MLIFKAIVYHPLDINFLELLKHSVHIIVRHSRTVKSYNGAKIQELAHSRSIRIGGFTRFGGNFSGFGNDFQRTVRRKVENKTLFLYFTVDGSWSLYPKNGLHIRRSRSVV